MNERIQILRKALKKTQQEFGDICGKSRTAIAKYETNKSVPDDAFIKLICLKFNVNEKWLRTGEGDMFVDDDDAIFKAFAQKYNLSATEQELVRYGLSLTSQQRADILSYARQISKILSSGEYATIAHRPAVSDENVDRQQVHDIIDEELDAVEKGKTSSASTSTNSPDGDEKIENRA